MLVIHRVQNPFHYPIPQEKQHFKTTSHLPCHHLWNPRSFQAPRHIRLLPRLCPCVPSVSASCLSSPHRLMFLLLPFCFLRQGPQCRSPLPPPWTARTAQVSSPKTGEVYLFQEVNLFEQFWVVVFPRCHNNQRIEKCRWLGSAVVGSIVLPGGVRSVCPIP